jgi:DNA replication initiation complex subunit (GINS family)
MDESEVEKLRRILESEENSEALNPLQRDAYVRLARYAQKLRVTMDSNGEDISGRLCRKQIWLIEAMTRRLLQLRLEKAEKLRSRNSLPEEESIVNSRIEAQKNQERFVRAVVDGHPSFFSLAQKRHVRRIVTVRILKPVGEIMGTDLRRYGPFDVHDLARVPAGNAELMVENSEAALVQGAGHQE